jgi:GNAT superfamily N-acetyltransferase
MMTESKDSEFLQATELDVPEIWDILRDAIARRKEDGSNQWQDGYPNAEIIRSDIKNGAGYVLVKGDEIIGYCAVLLNDEPEYEKINGKWLTNGDFVVFHRLAVSEKYIGKGWAKCLFKCIEELAVSKEIFSIKADTNHDNLPMLKIFEKTGFKYCGEVYFRNSPRKAFEKVIEAPVA